MKLKQLFCRHKKLTAVGIYQKILETCQVETTKYTQVKTCIVCKCDKCGKEFEFGGQELQTLRNQRVKDVNIDNVYKNKLWGSWW